MHNIKWIRENPKAFDEAMVRRGLAPVSDEILKHDAQRRDLQTKLQDVQQESNRLAKEIGALMGQGKKEEAQPLMERSSEVKAQLSQLKSQQENADEGTANSLLGGLLGSLPNIMDSDVPNGEDESENIELRNWSTPPEFGFKVKDHVDIGEALGLLDFESSATMSGARFSVLKGDLARLERALGNFMLDVHTNKFGYEEVSPPLLVRPGAMYGTSQLPKFAEDSFETSDGRYLIPTSEVPLLNMVSEAIVEEELLPIRLTARTPCFRSEAGSAGRDTRGLIRQHQFYKVELISIVAPDQGEEELERMTACAEHILQRLDLPYRVMFLCSGDTGFAARRTYDIEVWMPGQLHYREISSCSLVGDFQARRLNARCRPKGERETQFVHTLNGSGLAIGRCLVAILENYQNEDGTVRIPDALQPYMDGKTVITPC